MNLNTRKEAKDYIKALKAQLNEKGLLESVDNLAMELMEVTYNNYLDATEFLLENGATYEAISREGSVVTRTYPQVKIQRESQQDLVKLLKEFGATTNSRKNIKAVVTEEDALGDFLKGNPVEKR